MNSCKSLTLMTAALMLIATGSFAGNVLTNGDFEAGNLDGWVTYGVGGDANVTIEMGNGPTHPGDYGAYLANFQGAVGLGIKQTTAVGTAAEGTVNYSFDLKLDEAETGGVLFAEIFCEGEGVGIVGGSGLMGPFWAWEWTNFNGSFEAPAGTNFFTIQFTATTGAAIGSSCVAHVDNVELEQPNLVATESSSLGQVKALFR